jgi:hypothetical protein
VDAEGTVSTAVYSDCMAYRYALTRVWQASAPRLVYVMLNPSTATEVSNDPTIERCQRRAVALKYGAMRIVNLFAWRETSPKALRQAADPVGPQNDATLLEAAGWADDILCAWGVHGDFLGRDIAALRCLSNAGRRLLCLGTTQSGAPRHPLYVSYATRPTPWGQHGDPTGTYAAARS